MATRTYNPQVRVANWNEEIQLEEVGEVNYDINIGGKKKKLILLYCQEELIGKESILENVTVLLTLVT